MAVDVTVDGTTYPGVDTLTVGGKTLSLIAEGGDVRTSALKYATNVTIYGTVMTGDLVLDLAGNETAGTVSVSPGSGSSVTSFTFKNGAPTGTYRLFYNFAGYMNSKSIVVNFENFTLRKSNNLNQLFYGSGTVTAINGELEFKDGVALTDSFGAMASLQTITFKQSTIHASIGFYHSQNLTDASIVSIANGLDETKTGLSLTLNATPKARCSTLMGAVADGVFTQDAQGAVTLADFITNTKGWTLA